MSTHTPLDISRLDPEVIATLRSANVSTVAPELAFLYKFFRTIWSGKRPVLNLAVDDPAVEATVALGMDHHPRRTEGAILVTVPHIKLDEVNLQVCDAVVLGPMDDVAAAAKLFRVLGAYTSLGTLLVARGFTTTHAAAVPACIGLQGDALELVLHTDETYVYSIQASLASTPAPESPESLRAAFAHLETSARARGDKRLITAHRAQRERAIGSSGTPAPRQISNSVAQAKRLVATGKTRSAMDVLLVAIDTAIVSPNLEDSEEIPQATKMLVSLNGTAEATSQILRSLKTALQSTQARGPVATLLGTGEALGELGEREMAEQFLIKALSAAHAANDYAAAKRAERSMRRYGSRAIAIVPLDRHTGRLIDDESLGGPVTAEDGSPAPLDSLGIDSELGRYLDEISSQTTRAERRLLYQFFKTIWRGDGDVLEIGPFLGGTTRAIAMGMRDNPNFDDETALRTVDRFSHYCMNAEQFDDWVAPVFASGLVASPLKETLGNDFDFKRIFDVIHANQPYSDIVRSERGSLPIRPGEEDTLDDLFELEVTEPLSAVFVDGCKYWYSMKYFMKEIAPSVAPGTYFLFQDYSFTDCHFIPVFVGAMDDVFELVNYVDNTYVFLQKAPLAVEEVDRRFPDSIEDLGREAIDLLFARLLDEASARGDARSRVIYRLQHARLLSYLGDLESAWRQMENATKEPGAPAYQWFLDFARRQPLMLPDGRLRSLSWYPDGRRQKIAEYRDTQQDNGFTLGHAEGIMRSWHPNGELQAESVWKSGVQHGRSKEWDASGELVFDAMYRDGVLVSTARPTAFGTNG